MEQLKVVSSQNFMGKDIPVVLGGFGKDKKCMSDKTIAEIHGMEVKHVRELINRNLKRFKEDIDYIDLKVVVQNDYNLLEQLGYSKMQISKAEHIYILSERGYSKLIKIMDTDLAWEIHDQIMDEYFQLRDDKQKQMEGLSPQLQLLISMELKQKQQDEKLEKLDTKVESIKEVVALRPNAWRKGTTTIINKIALHLGGFEYIQQLREESYKLLEERMHVQLNIRLLNKKKNLLLIGACKSRIEKLNPLDVIDDDPKLIEGYISIIKELAIKYGVTDVAKKEKQVWITKL